MDALIWTLAVIVLLAFGVAMTQLRHGRLAQRILVYELGSLLLVVEILLVGAVGGYEAARHIALLFGTLSIVGGYALILRFGQLVHEDDAPDDAKEGVDDR